MLGRLSQALMPSSSIVPAPTLDLNYASAMAFLNGESFSRSSGATYTDSTGAIATAKLNNLVVTSENYTASPWTRVNTTVTANSANSPTGTLTASKAVPSTSNLLHQVQQSLTILVPGTYTLSIYAANAGYGYALLCGSNSSGRYAIVVDLSNGNVTATGTGFTPGSVSYAVTAENNSFYRLSLTMDFTTSSNAFVFAPCSTGTPSLDSNLYPVFAGDGTKGVYFWGAQFEPGSSATAYAKAPGSTAAVPRFGYDPFTKGPVGLLLEDQVTNFLLNSANLSTQSVTVTAHLYVLSFYGTGQVVLSGTSSATIVGVGSYPNRTVYGFTPTAGTLTLTVTGTVQYAQLEQQNQSFATSYIPTGAAQATRAQDYATLPITGLYNSSEFTIIANFIYAGLYAASVVGLEKDSSNGTVVSVSITYPSCVRSLSKVSGTATQDMLNPNALSPKVKYKVAVAVKPGDSAMCVNGGSVYPSASSGVLTGYTTLTLGYSAQVIASLKSGYLQRVRLYDRRLSNAAIQALTR
ncbi:MAG: hypothetical protein WCF85_20390 [Rhodospirillaceae bacterium]